MPSTPIEIEWEGKVYEWRLSELTTLPAVRVEEHTKRSGLIGFEDGIRECNQACMQALLWDMRRQAGETNPPMRTLDFSHYDLWVAYVAAASNALVDKHLADAAAGIEPDPTGTPEPPTQPERTPATPEA